MCNIVQALGGAPWRISKSVLTHIRAGRRRRRRRCRVRTSNGPNLRRIADRTRRSIAHRAGSISQCPVVFMLCVCVYVFVCFAADIYYALHMHYMHSDAHALKRWNLFRHQHTHTHKYSRVYKSNRASPHIHETHHAITVGGNQFSDSRADHALAHVWVVPLGILYGAAAPSSRPTWLENPSPNLYIIFIRIFRKRISAGICVV